MIMVLLEDGGLNFLVRYMLIGNLDKKELPLL